ncbi:MAG: ATP synthase F1 subunit gamma [Buchnera aphidicola (Nurudea yanoniella)]
MSEIKEIRNKIYCIKNTQKITRAMEMISISKMKKSELKMNSGRPYLNVTQAIVNNILSNNTKYKHVFFEKRERKRIGIIIISTDRGLCSCLNTTLFKKVKIFIETQNSKNITCNLSILGLKGISFFQFLSKNIIYSETNLKKNYEFSNYLNFINIFIKYYNEKKIDNLFVAFNKFKNTFIQTPLIIQLLPLSKKIDIKKKNNYWDYIYESNSKRLLDKLFKNYIQSQIYQAILENYACEQVARMIAMKQATDNSKKLIQDLQISYNKARQDNITQELTEIVSGASAIS